MSVYRIITLFCLKVMSIYALSTCFTSCATSGGYDLTPEEKALINSADSIMRVLTIESEEDMAVLRDTSTDLSASSLMSDEFRRLSGLMISTVTHPSQDGVGIAAPQVGLNRRVIAVQRFDKAADSLGNHPFEIYANIRLISASDSLAPGPEGCLSVPGRHGEVLRSQSVVIEYADMAALEKLTMKKSTETIPVIRETVSGFAAVIFQHEIDHLDGILYIDRL